MGQSWWISLGEEGWAPMLSAEAVGKHPYPKDTLEISTGLYHLGHPTPCLRIIRAVSPRM